MNMDSASECFSGCAR